MSTGGLITFRGDLLQKGGALATSIKCCCCLPSYTVYVVRGDYFEVNWPGTVPEPPPGILDPDVGFLLGVTYRDCRNVAGVYTVDWILLECGNETGAINDGFLTPFLDWATELTGFNGPNTETVESFIEEGDEAVDHYFTEPITDCQDFEVQTRNSVDTCCIPLSELSEDEHPYSDPIPYFD